MSVLLGSSNRTIHYENGEQVYPCRCGQTHRGAYAAHDWHHHNCFHDAELHRFMPDEEPDALICPQCGEVFWIEGSDA